MGLLCGANFPILPETFDTYSYELLMLYLVYILLAGKQIQDTCVTVIYYKNVME